MEELTDRTIVLRDGRVVVSGKTSEISREEILRNMVGGEITKVNNQENKQFDEVIMRVEDLTVGNKPNHVSFDLHRGEVLCIWGLMGSGRTETLRAIFGLDKTDCGSVSIDAGDGRGLRKIPFSHVREYCGYVTEARHDDGCLLPQSVWENMTAPNLKAYLKTASSWILTGRRRTARTIASA